MATSIQNVGRHVEFFDDLDLLLAIQFLLAELQTTGVQTDLLAQLADVWREQLAVNGPGTIDMELERLLSNRAARDEFIDLLSRVQDVLKGEADPIPSASLDSRFRLRNVRFNDYPVSRLRYTLDRLRALFNQTP